MMRECLITITILHVVSPFVIKNIISEQSNLVLCLQKILLKHIAQERPLLVSYQATVNDAIQTSPGADNLQLVGSLLRYINVEDLWPLYVYQVDNSGTFNNTPVILPHKPYSYVIFIGPEKDDERLRGALYSQMLPLVAGTYFNPTARFIIVVSGYCSEIENFLIFIFWLVGKGLKVENLVTVIAKHEPSQYDINEDMYGLVESKNFDIYSYFPYEGRRCGDNLQPVLVDRCYIEHAGELSYNTHLFPNKVPNSFAGCPVTVLMDTAEPYLVQVNKSADLYENEVLRFRGLHLEYLTHVTEVLNLSVEIVTTPDLIINSENVNKIYLLLQSGIFIDNIEASIPYIFDVFKWYVPCPKSALRTDSILEVFSFSVWLAALSIVLLTGLVFWFSAKCSYRSVVRESHSYRTVIRCMYDVWCVFMGVSVAEMPKTSRVRVVFCLFVCYSFVISTIFQSFFVSFLVSPSNLKPITTLEELLNSSLKYGKNPDIHEYLERSEYEGLERLNLDMVECPDKNKCLERLFTQGDIAVVSPTIEAQFIASRIDMAHGKVLCSLDEHLFSTNHAMYVIRGDPILGVLNIILRRCMEAGLVEKLWSEFNFVIKLQNARKSKNIPCEVCSDNFDVYSLSHLKVAFLVLGFGYALCTTVFLAEIFWKWCSATVFWYGMTPFPYIN
jgi:hypothetical protein